MAETLFAQNYFETSEAHRKIRNGILDVLSLLEAKDVNGLSKYTASLDFIVVDKNNNTLLTSDTSKFMVDFRQGNYIVYEDNEITDTGGAIGHSILGDMYVPFHSQGLKTIISFPDEYWDGNFENFDELKSLMHEFIRMIAPSLQWLLIALVFFIWTAGKKPHSDELHHSFPDKMWTEVHIFALLGLIFTAIAIAVVSIDACSSNITTTEFRLGKSIVCALTEVIFCLCLWIFLSVVRKIKGKSFFRTSFCGWFIIKSKHFFAKTKQIIRNLSDVQFKDVHFAAGFHKIQVRFIAISVIMAILISFFAFMAGADGYTGWLFFGIFLAIIELVIIRHYMKKTTAYSQSMARLLVQIDKVSSGNLDYDAGIGEDDYLIESSTKLANISEGLSEALEEQMKGERMKIELITNVSHNLKTPLTSIISYIDLLKKEEMNDAAKDYVNILSHKADRLKGIVSDLFDLAKTNSGNAQLEIKPLDFSRLTHQLLADMEDKIAESGMKIKLNLPDSPAVITADGKKLSRALQNVVDNALKYSLSGSRIYIDLVKNEGNAILSVKNTSSYEMDFTADEIMQRFVRGDKNRSSDGSGLGLSIAQSFTHVSGGSFDVMIDGDQFKTVFTFLLTDEQMNNESGDII